MNTIYTKFSIVLVLFSSLIACQKGNLELNEQSNMSDSYSLTTGMGQKISLTATTQPQTRISFSDEGSDGVKMFWAKGDSFTIYNDTFTIAGKFILNSGEATTSATFVPDGWTELKDGMTFTAIYPRTSLATVEECDNYTPDQIQKGANSLSHLDSSCKMKGTFVWDEENSTANIEFHHQLALLSATFNLPATYNEAEDGVISALEFWDGDKLSTLLFSEMEGVNSPITAHLFIEPCSGERTLEFELLTSKGKCFRFATSTSKEYLAGSRYLAPIGDGFEPDSNANCYWITPPSGEKSIDDIPSNETTWVVMDSEIGAKSSLYSALLGREYGSINLILPNVTSLNFDAQSDLGVFDRASALRSVTMTEIETIGESAFNSCTYLSTITAPKAKEVQTQAFVVCSSLKNVTMPNLTTIGADAFGECKDLVNIDFPLLKTINIGAFRSCDMLIGVNIPACEKVGEMAFYFCDQLQNISLDKATSIGREAFMSCLKLSTLSIPLVTTIGEGAFYSCYKLEEISAPKATTLGGLVFKSCTGLKSASLPNVTKAGEETFYDCSSLESIEMGKLAEIGETSFAMCSKLKTLEIGTTSKLTKFGDASGDMFKKFWCEDGGFDLSNIELISGYSNEPLKVDELYFNMPTSDGGFFKYGPFKSVTIKKQTISATIN